LKEREFIRENAVETLRLEGFRNYAHLDLRLSPGFNVVSGPNAQGKTNLLESLYLLGTTRLLRGQKDAEAIQDGSERASAEVILADSGTRIGVTLERGSRKRALVNGLALPRAADLIGRLPVVCISAADMAIVRGEPADRRLFLDLELSALSPAYLHHFALYKRAQEQRGALLRQSRERAIPGALYEPWEAAMATHGAHVRAARVDYVSRLIGPTQEVHAQMGGGEALELRYEPKDEATDEEGLRTLLESSRAQDVVRGATSLGPHRDDLRLEVAGRDARLFGSQGQQRTAVIALKLATLDVAREERGVPPLLLLDDILSDLDEERRANLVEVVLDRAAQAVLTCTEASAAGERILSQAQLFKVDSGTVQPANDSERNRKPH
jgi:DNA replication and repair protein RecF